MLFKEIEDGNNKACWCDLSLLCREKGRGMRIRGRRIGVDTEKEGAEGKVRGKRYLPA